ncbi:MAG TPA: DUF1269 domain-containing protein [Candidatus Paceibacterota bacterium]|nr:DUF1269 domain-containing protein [Candidatus Paceibacterota bacterium]
MKKTTIGVFVNRSDAEKFINYIHNKVSVPTDDISYVYKNTFGEEKEIDAGDVSSMSTGEGAATGAKTGAVIGALGGIVAVIGLVPGLGPLLVAGPLLATLGVTGAIGATAAGAITGAAVGGLLGALLNLGVGTEKAKVYEDRVMAGDILVAVNSESDQEVEKAMMDHNAIEVETHQVTV